MSNGQTTLLAQITAPHFCAGLMLIDDVCKLAAPILSWAIGKRRDEIRTYCSDNGWNVKVVKFSR